MGTDYTAGLAEAGLRRARAPAEGHPGKKAESAHHSGLLLKLPSSSARAEALCMLVPKPFLS